MTKEELFLQKEWLRKVLIDSIATITFTKVNGEQRVMKCTLQEQFLPSQVDLEEAIQKKKPNEETMSVWDLEARAWRSFRIENLISVEVIDNASSD
jgi:hypothetical protein